LQKATLNKSIPARKLSPSGVLTNDPEETIPFGSILEQIQRDRDLARFRYLGYLYRCPYELLASAVDKQALPDAAPAAPAAAPAPAEEAKGPKLEFTPLHTSGASGLSRAKVPGGWLIAANGSIAFYPDAEHSWDGGSL
jgi:hypothetical protein